MKAKVSKAAAAPKAVASAAQDSVFDAAYYERFYESDTTQVHDVERAWKLAQGVVSMVEWFGADLQKVLEVGAGVGHMRDWFAKNRVLTAYVSTEVSAYACKQYGHRKFDVARDKLKERFDLVICQGVLPYLNDDEADAALTTLGSVTRGFLYLEAVTKLDLQTVCDREKTDLAIFSRAGEWYRKRLHVYFDEVGCGLYYSNRGSLPFYELEVPKRKRASG